MKYSVIYTANWKRAELSGPPATVKLSDMIPKPAKRGLWHRTENSNQSDYEDMNHGKWVAILDQAQFDEFVEHADLEAERVETMGAIGSPACGFGWSPAISFSNCLGGGSVDAFQNAYVTPLPNRRNGDPIRTGGHNERDWERVKRAILSVYGR